MGGHICFTRVSLLSVEILRPWLSIGKQLVFWNGWDLGFLHASGFMEPIEVQNLA